MIGSGKQTIKIIPVIVLAILMTGLSVSSFDYARAIAAHQPQSLASWNLLANNRVNRIADLQLQIKNHQTLYKNAFWPQQRQQAQLDLFELRKQKLNLTPYSAEDWLSLLVLLPEEATPVQARLWAIESAIRNNKWQLLRRPDLAYYCIHYDDRLSASLVQECRLLIAGLPWQNRLPHLARLVGVEQARLELALSQAGAL